MHSFTPNHVSINSEHRVTFLGIYSNPNQSYYIPNPNLNLNP